MTTEQRTTVYATGEHMRPNEAYEIAHGRLWDQLANIQGARLLSIDQQITTRPAIESTLDPESFTVTPKATSTVIVALLAVVAYPVSGDKQGT